MNLTINNISKTFKQKNNSINVLNNISYDFKENKLYFITGESGEGKSTLLSMLGLLDDPTSGEILFDGKSVPLKERNKFISDHISFVFQDYNLFEELTIYENLSLFIDDKNKIKELLESFNIDSNINKKIKYLSGGEKQRLAILRAIIKGGDILLFDEPTGNLDKDNTIEILNIIKGLSKNHLCIIVSHDLEMANEYGDIVLTIKDKKLYESFNFENNAKEFETVIINYKKDVIPQLSFLKRYYPKNGNLLILENEFGKFEITNENIFEVINKINKTKTNKEVITKIRTEKRNENHPLDFSFKNSQFNKRFLKRFSNKVMLSKLLRIIGSSILSIVFGMFLFIESNVLALNYGEIVTSIIEKTNIQEFSLCKITDYSTIENGYLFNKESKQIIDETYNFEEIEIPNEEEKTLSLYILENGQKFIYNKMTYDIDKTNKVILSENAKKLFDLNNIVYYENSVEINTSLTIPNKNDNLVFAVTTKEYLNNFIFNQNHFTSYPSLFNEKTKESFGSEKGFKYSFSSYKDELLEYGKMPEANNEVVISVSLAEKITKNISSLINREYNTEDLVKNVQEDFYPTVDYEQISINSFEIFGPKIKIVGIYKNEPDSGTNVDILVTNSMYKLISNESFFNLQKNVVIKDNLTATKINKLYKNRVFFSDFDYSLDYTVATSFADLYKRQANTLLIVLLIIFFLALFLSIFLYVSHIIKDNYHQIAILKSMGISDKTIFKSFFNVVLIPSLISYLISIGLGLILVSSINKIVKANASITISILTVNPVSIFVPLICFIAIPLLISLIYLIKIVKIRPYEALKEFK